MQWYENNPVLLEVEKIVMSKHFPDFSFEFMDDGRASWTGVITSSEQHKEYAVLVVYDVNHPTCHEEFSSVKIYPVIPDTDEMFDSVTEYRRREWLLKDTCDNGFMCLHTDLTNIDNSTTLTAAFFLQKAIVWVNNYENEFKQNSK